jgi:hypothetical protein
MINWFLKMKHWQLFILLFVLPVILFFASMGVFMYQILHDTKLNEMANPRNFFESISVFYIPILIVSYVHLAWYWCIVIGLQKSVPVHIAMKIEKFNFLFWSQIYIVALFGIAVFYFADRLSNAVFEQDFKFIIIYFIIAIPLGLYSLFCAIYIMYCAAKTYKTVQLQREVNFMEFIGEFFLIWHYPIGIWFIQPKLNHFYEVQKQQGLTS